MNLSESYKNRLQKLANISESKSSKKKLDAGDEIHLPDLTMKKKDLLKYLKELYNLVLKEEE
jgi:hypothetical protein